jgi:hypothetical protein
LRHITLAIGSATSIFFLYQKKSQIFTYSAWPLYIFIGIFPWLVFHLLFLSHEFNQQYSELRSLWLRCSLAIPIGFTTGIFLSQNYIESQNNPTQHTYKLLARYNPESIKLMLIYAGLGGYAFISLGYLFFHWCYAGQTPEITPDMSSNLLYRLYKAKIPFVVGGAFFLPLCFILIIRSINHKGYLWALLGLLGAATGLFVAFFSNTKNGMAIFLIVLIVSIVNCILRLKGSHPRIRLAAFIIGIMLFLSFFIISKHLEQNPAWFNLLANVEVGANIDGEKFWRYREANSLSPSNKYGVQVDDSTYERSAWFTAGLLLLTENPLGFGLVRHSFGWLAISKWPDFYKPAIEKRGATHSGWLDLALGIGIPGVLLIWVPLLVSWRRSLSHNGIWFSYTSWAIPIMCFAYLTSEANGQHFIELLFFFVAFFSGITANAGHKSLEPQ